VGGKGNEGVASYVQRVRGAIGYVEYAYALQNKLVHALVQNRDGVFVAPGIDTFRAAAAGAQWDKAPGMYLILTDQPGKTAWPISGATFILMHKVQDRPERAREVLKFFRWAYTEGSEIAIGLDYVPLPESVVKSIEANWRSQIKDARGRPVWP
jgi:phosphate transport system substrate-binding protein